MGLFSLLTALLVEHFHPLTSRLPVYLWVTRYANFLERHFNAGQHRHGVIAWVLGVVPALIAVSAVYFALYFLSPLLALAWNAAVLYGTMGFKYFANTNAAIADALKTRDVTKARDLLGKWRGGGVDELEANEIARLGIEQTFQCAHRQIFAPIAWFLALMPLGPVGPVLYRLASMLAHKWGDMDNPDFGDFGRFSARAFELLDWVPVRLTAISFAIVGDFEDAVYCWRTQAAAWPQRGFGVILAAGAGALGIRLGEPLHQGGILEMRPELGLGDEADTDYMQSAVSLIWRALTLWMVLLFMLQIAKWSGG